MSREMPFECPHGNMLGGDESFGHADDRCEMCELEQKMARNRKVDLTMFAGYHLGWLVLKGGKVPSVSYNEIHAMIDEYCEKLLPIYRKGDGDTDRTASARPTSEDTP